MPLKALVFDVFGTVVDWRSSIAREVHTFALKKGLAIDAYGFADEWRSCYGPNMDKVRRNNLAWINLDDLHRMALNRLLNSKRFSLNHMNMDEVDKKELNKAWHKLEPWSDSIIGLNRLKERFIIAPLSNGNISLMTNLSKYGQLPWDCILGAELAKHYKPDMEVYQSAIDILGIQPSEIMMVAAHLSDLYAARKLGMKTAFVYRPDEFGNDVSSIDVPDVVKDIVGEIDVVAKDMIDLSNQLHSKDMNNPDTYYNTS